MRRVHALGVLGVVAVERVAELVVSRSNARWAMERGGREHGAGHYPVMVVLHTALLGGAAAEAVVLRREPPRSWPVLLAVCVGSQALRWWCIRTLGRQWNTRVVVVPGLALVERGPYRVIPHPNYVAVVAEGVALPLLAGSRWTAVTFTGLNALLLRHRIRVEERALRAGAPA